MIDYAVLHLSLPYWSDVLIHLCFRIHPALALLARVFPTQHGFWITCSEFRVQGSRFRVQGSEFGVQGSGFRVQVFTRH